METDRLAKTPLIWRISTIALLATGVLCAFTPAGTLGQNADPRPDIARDTLSPQRLSPTFEPETESPAPVIPFSGDEESDLFGTQLILVDRPVYDPWTLTGDFGVYRTDNVALSPVNELDDTYFLMAAGFAFDPKITQQLFGHAHLNQAFYLYDQFDVLDFDYLDSAVGLSYFPMPTGTLLDVVLADSMVFLNYGYDRTSESGFGSSIFDNHAIIMGWQKAIAISQTHALYLGYVADLSLGASSDIPRRNEHSLSAAYRVQWSPKLFTTLAWQSAYHDYFSFGREDWNHSLSLLAEAKLTDQLSLYGSLSWMQNASNLDVFDYERFDYGGMIGLRFQFGGKAPPFPGFPSQSETSAKNPISATLSK